jgi:phosphatidylserine/phosphatidylglycerophosphate/cardiolipin synthase-like enzyme
LLIYDPFISDREMLRILRERVRAGVEVHVVGSVAGGHAGFEVQKLAGRRLHTRTIIRDRRQAFVGSQSLRRIELDSRREVGLIVRDALVVKALVETFESDWRAAATAKTHEPVTEAAVPDTVAPVQANVVSVSAREAQEAVRTLTKGLEPLAATVKKAVRIAVARVGEDVLNDADVKDTMKKVVKKAVKDAVKDAVRDAQGTKDPG